MTGLLYRIHFSDENVTGIAAMPEMRRVGNRPRWQWGSLQVWNHCVHSSRIRDHRV